MASVSKICKYGKQKPVYQLSKVSNIEVADLLLVQIKGKDESPIEGIENKEILSYYKGEQN